MSEYQLAAEAVAGPSMDVDSGSEQDDQLDLANEPLAQHGRRVGNSTAKGTGKDKGKGKGSSLKRSRSSTVDSEVRSSTRTPHREPEPRAAFDLCTFIQLAATTTKPKRKRNRAALSCAPCKKRKVREPVEGEDEHPPFTRWTKSD